MKRLACHSLACLASIMFGISWGYAILHVARALKSLINP